MHSSHKMWPIATDRVAWFVCLLVPFVSPAKTGYTDRDAVRGAYLRWPKEPCIRWGSRSQTRRCNLWGCRAHRKALEVGGAAL